MSQALAPALACKRNVTFASLPFQLRLAGRNVRSFLLAVPDYAALPPLPHNLASAVAYLLAPYTLRKWIYPELPLLT